MTIQSHTGLCLINRRVYRDMTGDGELFYYVKPYLPDLRTDEAEEKIICWAEIFLRPSVLHKIEGGGDYPEPLKRYVFLSTFSDICKTSPGDNNNIPARIGFVIDSNGIIHEHALRCIIEANHSDDVIIRYPKEKLVDFFQKILDDVSEEMYS